MVKGNKTINTHSNNPLPGVISDLKTKNNVARVNFNKRANQLAERQQLAEIRYQALQQSRIRDSKRRSNNFNQQTLTKDPYNHWKEKIENDARVETVKGMYQATKESKIKAAAKALQLGVKLRKQMQEGDSSALQAAYILAFVLDFAIDLIPVAALIISLFASMVLFIMLWGYGNWKVKTVRFILLTLEIAPVVGMLPMNIVCVVHAQRVLKKRAEKAKERYERLKLQMSEA